MKTETFSNSQIVRYTSELRNHFQVLLQDHPELNFKLQAGSLPETLTLEFDGRKLQFSPIYELGPSLPWLDTLGDHAGYPRILITAHLSARVLEHCKKRRIAAIDLNGRVYLRADGVLIDRRALPDRSFRYELEPRSIFVGKSASIVRTLLTDRDRVWTQAEIVPRSKASSGLVSRIVQHLIRQGFAEKTAPRAFRLREPFQLLEAWAKADQFSKRARTTRYAGVVLPPQEVARRLQDWARRESVSIAFTQWTGAWKRHAYTEPPLTSAYVSRLPDTATVAAHGLREVSEAGKLWLHVPAEEGVFLETQTGDGLPLASDAQIYLDLQGTGLRGPDAAKALREWEGFCRP